MNEQKELASLVKELIEANQTLATTLERIVIGIEQLSGHIPEDRGLSAVVSQLAGLHIRAADLLECLVQGENPLPERADKAV